MGSTIKNLLVWLALAVGLMAAFNAITKEQENKQQITYSEFINQVKKVK